MIPRDSPSCYDSAMRNLVVLFIHFIATLARLLGPGGVRSLVAESLLLKHQLLMVNRSRQRSPNLPSSDRILAGLLALLVRPPRLLRSAIVLKPSTLLALHKTMSKRKYRMLFSPDRRRKPGPKGPSAELIQVVVEMKQRNPTWGCPRIAQQMALAFNIQIDKDVVRRILAHHYLPGQDSDGPSIADKIGVGFELPNSILASVVLNVPKMAAEQAEQALAKVFVICEIRESASASVGESVCPYRRRSIHPKQCRMKHKCLRVRVNDAPVAQLERASAF